MKDNSALTRG